MAFSIRSFAEDCKNKAEAYVKSEIKKDCSKAPYKILKTENQTDRDSLKEYGMKSDELLSFWSLLKPLLLN